MPASPRPAPGLLATLADAAGPTIGAGLWCLVATILAVRAADRGLLWVPVALLVWLGIGVPICWLIAVLVNKVTAPLTRRTER